MSNKTNENTAGKTNPISKDDDIIDVKLLIAKLIQNWYYFAIGIIICFILAFIYAHIASSNWHVASKILVNDSKDNASSAINGSFGSGISSVLSANSDASNEIQILKSRTLMQNTVNEMQLNIRTYRKDGFKKIEIFDESPFTIIADFKQDTITQINYGVKVINANTFQITNKDEGVDIKTEYGKVVNLKQLNLILKKNTLNNSSGEFIISIQSSDAAVSTFAGLFSASLADKQATAIDLSLTYPNPKKGEAILNKLMEIYLRSNQQNEVQIANATMSFINERIDSISKELNTVERKLQSYKQDNNIADITEQSKVLVGSASEYYDKLNQQQIQLSIVSDLERYLNSPANRKIIPSALALPSDLAFSQSITSYNELLLARDKATLSYTDNNPVIQNIDKQIENARQNLIKNLLAAKKNLTTGRDQLQRQNSNFTGQLKQVPVKERRFLDFQRQQNLFQALYLFLLQKREETAISRTSTLSSSRIVDKAKSDYLPFEPKKQIIYLIGIIMGLALPALFLFGRDLLNVRINSKQDIENATDATIIGEIGHNSDKQSLVTGTNSRSVISEQFRSLRTNLQFISDQSKSNVLLFTSSMSGEGKSFLSLNIGSALALTGKKVVFLELDLRRPKLSESVGMDINNGFTNYAISDDSNFDFRKLLKPLAFNENCYLISAGPIPPNPAELLVNGKIEKLLSELKNEFDYILIDCAPVGLVTDALMLEKFADITFYVLRQDFTYKSQINIINDLRKERKVKNLYLIVNDIKSQKGGYSSYAQSYGYGLEENRSFWSKLKFWN